MNDVDDYTGRNDWWLDARCRGLDPNLFHAERGQDDRKAKRICATCPVQEPCLEEALARPTFGDYGVWGGTSARTRRQIRAKAKVKVDA